MYLEKIQKINWPLDSVQLKIKVEIKVLIENGTIKLQLATELKILE